MPTIGVSAEAVKNCCKVFVGPNVTCGQPVKCSWGACTRSHCLLVRPTNIPSTCDVHGSAAQPAVLVEKSEEEKTKERTEGRGTLEQVECCL